MRLIDAESETLIKQINLKFGGVNRFNVKWLLHNAPTVDAVPVVRCKDCKHWETCCHMEVSKANDFCSYGERRKEQWPNHPAPPAYNRSGAKTKTAKSGEPGSTRNGRNLTTTMRNTRRTTNEDD